MNTNGHGLPLTPAPLPIGWGEGRISIYALLPRAALVPHLPWADFVLPRWGGSYSRLTPAELWS